MNDAFGSEPSALPAAKKKKKIYDSNSMALVPILEEPKKGYQMAAYKPDASLAD